uniref:Si:dkeyp-80c12.8 n=1 Tax=Electrophorus electricus TaxID=8005 RepID=A0AAY5ELI9_ELEEL
MKTIICATLLLLAFSYGEALKCNLCISSPFQPCTPSVQNCRYYVKGCGNVQFLSGPLASSSIRSCMDMATCRNYQNMPNTVAICCSTDLCN